MRKGRIDADFCTTAIHGIDTLKYIVESDYKDMRFTYQEFSYNNEKVCNYYLSTVFENGVIGNLSFLPCSGSVVERIRVSVEDYSFFFELPVWNGMDVPGKLVCAHAGQVYKTIIGNKDTMFECSGFYDENASFFDFIRSGQAPESDVITGLQAVEIAEYMRNRKEIYCKG